MNTMNRKAAMCDQLNMSFDEANELFGEESLESMQMARVNGGIGFLAVLGAIAAVVAIAAGTVQIYQWIIDDDTTPSETDLETARKELEEKTKDTIEVEIDSVKQSDGTVFYGIKMTQYAPTLAQ